MQKWWDVTSEIRLPRDWFPVWACPLPLLLWGKTGAVLWAAPWRGPHEVSGLQPGRTWGCQQPREWAQKQILPHTSLWWMKPCSPVRDPEQEALAVLCLDCWPTETVVLSCWVWVKALKKERKQRQEANLLAWKYPRLLGLELQGNQDMERPLTDWRKKCKERGPLSCLLRVWKDTLSHVPAWEEGTIRSVACVSQEGDRHSILQSPGRQRGSPELPWCPQRVMKIRWVESLGAGHGPSVVKGRSLVEGMLLGAPLGPATSWILWEAEDLTKDWVSV